MCIKSSWSTPGDSDHGGTSVWRIRIRPNLLYSLEQMVKQQLEKTRACIKDDIFKHVSYYLVYAGDLPCRQVLPSCYRGTVETGIVFFFFCYKSEKPDYCIYIYICSIRKSTASSTDNLLVIELTWCRSNRSTCVGTVYPMVVKAYY